MRNKLMWSVTALAVLVWPYAALGANVLLDLGPGGAEDISQDGMLVAGNDAGGGFYWTPSSGKVSIGNQVVGAEYFGGSPLVAGNISNNAAVWQSGSWSALPKANEAYDWRAEAVGSDGTTDYWVAGYARNTPYNRATRYKHTSVSSTTIDLPPSGHDHSYYYGASDNGVFVGKAQYTGSPPSGGSRNGMVYSPAAWLPPVGGPTGSLESETFNVSSDGNVKVGWGYTSGGAVYSAYWWDSGNAPHVIPIFANQDWMEALSVDGDGTVIGGRTYLKPAYTQAEAWIYDVPTDSLQTVAAFLSGLGVDITGWTFSELTGISNDGLSLAGKGKYLGVDHGWAYVVPEPATLAVAMLVLPLLRRRRR